MMTVADLVRMIEDGSVRSALKDETFISFGSFTMDEHNGLTKMMRVPNGKSTASEPRWISAPFEVLGACRDPHGRAWGKQIQFRDGDGRVHRKHVADAALQVEPASLCALLADSGLRINRSKQSVFAEYLSGVAVGSRVTVVQRTGWHEVGGAHVFVLPHETLGAPDLEERVTLDVAAQGPYEAKGRLEDWKKSVGTFAGAHALLTFAISTAFAGPLARFVEAESGGFHLFGSSSTGKSTALCAAASVWGRGSARGGFVRSWRSTANGLEGAAATANDALLALDELGVGDARDVSAAIYQLSNGVGKMRADRDGSLRKPKDWRVTILSSGEVPVDAKIDEERKGLVRAGQLVRVLDIPADRGLGFGVFDSAGGFSEAGKLADAIKDAAITAYGTAGPAFVRLLVRLDRDDVTSVIRKRLSELATSMVPAGASEQVGRVAKRFALVAIAGELAAKSGITPWGRGDAEMAAIEAFRAWLDRRGGAGTQEERQAVERVRHTIVMHGDARFEQVSDIKNNIGIDKVQNRLGWRKGEGEEREWWVPAETWKRDFCQGLDPTYVAKTLAVKGMLRRQDSKHLTCVRKVGGLNMRVYVLTAIILDASDGS